MILACWSISFIIDVGTYSENMSSVAYYVGQSDYFHTKWLHAHGTIVILHSSCQNNYSEREF